MNLIVIINLNFKYSERLKKPTCTCAFAQSYKINISAMQGYASQRDELNHLRPMNTFRFEPSIYMMNRYGRNNHRAPKKKKK
jgi:hypothetical protein